MTNRQHTLRVALVDDHNVVRRGMRTFLESFADITVVAEAATAEEALARLDDWDAEIVLMDLLLPGGMDGIEATRQIARTHPQVRVVVLTAYTDEARAIAALRAGARGYVLKDASPETLLETIRAVARGQRAIDPALSQDLLSDNGSSPLYGLTPRELDVLRQVAQGKTNHEIAAELVLGEETVKSHVASILGKLGLTSRSQVAAYALKQGLLRLDEI